MPFPDIMMKCERKKKSFNAKLFVRILPTTDLCYDSIKLENNRQVLYVKCLQDLNRGIEAKNPNYWSFCTDGVFWNSSQSEVFETVASDWYDDLFDGVSGIILSYGQTGSGKTFTTSGLRLPYENRGLILRILSRLFLEEEQRRDVRRISFGMSYLEFVGEVVRDLMNDRTVQNIKEVAEHMVPNEEWAWKQIFNVECKKSYSEEAPYISSNRGHSVLTFYIHAESLIDTDPVLTHSKIHIVDMAGIGDYGKATSWWKAKKDVGQNNLSKSLMEQLIICLTGGTWKEEGHICPYKCSKFLMFLHDTLQPNCFIRFVAHIYGNEANLPVTLSTLKFGEKLKALKPMKLQRIIENNYVLQLRNLEKECLRLREEAELTDMLKNSPGYCDMSQARLLQIKRAAEEFLHGQLENLTLFSFGQAAITLETFRDLYYKLSAEKDQMIKDAITTATQILQDQFANEKNLTSPSAVISNTQRMSRRKSRQQDSQYAFGASFRSIDSSQLNMGKSPSVIQQAGFPDRRGISIGPGKLSTTFEGNITKAFKKLKTRRSDSLVTKTGRSLPAKDVNINLSKMQGPEDVTECPLPQCIPSRETAWLSFCSENPDLVSSMRSNVENHEEEVRVSRTKYAAALTELADLREKIKDSKIELENCRHIRQLYRRHQFDEDENSVSGQIEKELKESKIKKEEQLSELIENCHVALIDLKALTEDLNGAKRALEEAFQDYCKINYKVVFLPEGTPSEDEGSEGSAEESPCELELKNHFMSLYSLLQEKLLNYVPKKEKKEWKKY